MCPFGMMMPNRSYSPQTGYRYGFNGKENDNEVRGDGNELDYGARIYDTRLGRWLSIDPMQSKFPNESPYIYAGNNPNLYVDPDGKKKYIIHIIFDENTGKKTMIKYPVSNELMRKTFSTTVERGSGNDAYTSQQFHVGYYDINEIHTTVIKKDGTLSQTVRTDQGALRKKDPFVDAQWYVNLRIGDGIETGGGIVFYSEIGKGEETRKGTYADGQMENIDDLTEGLNQMKNAAEAQGVMHYIEEVLTKKKKVDKVISIVESVKDIMEKSNSAIQAGDKIEKVAGKAKEIGNKKPKDVIIWVKTNDGDVGPVVQKISADPADPDTFVVKYQTQEDKKKYVPKQLNSSGKKF